MMKVESRIIGQDSWWDTELQKFKQRRFDLAKVPLKFRCPNCGKIVVKPDLILKNKKTGENILIDYKTSKLKGNKYDKSKLEGYKKQFLLYTYFTWLNQDVEITKIIIWFIRNNQEFEIKIEHDEIMETLEWFEKGVASAKNDTEWEPNLKSSNKFFCENLCSVYEYCEGRNPNAISELSQT